MQFGENGTAETVTKLQIMNISKVAAPFRYVTFVNYVMFIAGIYMVRNAAINVLTTKPTIVEVAGRGIELVLEAYWAWTAMRDTSVLSNIKGVNIYIALLLMGFLSHDFTHF
jgi:hypothetical protein